MLRLACLFLSVAAIAALFGFVGPAAGAAALAEVLFLVFLILGIGTFLFGPDRDEPARRRSR